MDALAELRITLILRVVVTARALVARLPALAAILGVEHAGGGDAGPQLLRIGRVRHQRVQDQPAAARHPAITGRMRVQPRHRHPALAAIGAAEQARRLHPGIEAAIGRPGQAPDRLYRLLALGIGKTNAGMAPALPAIGRFPHRRPEPGVAAAGIDGAGLRIADHMIDRPGLAERAAQREILPGRIAFQNEGALLGAQQNQQSLRHPILHA